MPWLVAIKIKRRRRLGEVWRLLILQCDPGGTRRKKYKFHSFHRMVVIPTRIKRRQLLNQHALYSFAQKSDVCIGRDIQWRKYRPRKTTRLLFPTRCSVKRRPAAESWDMRESLHHHSSTPVWLPKIHHLRLQYAKARFTLTKYPSMKWCRIMRAKKLILIHVSLCLFFHPKF